MTQTEITPNMFIGSFNGKKLLFSNNEHSNIYHVNMSIESSEEGFLLDFITSGKPLKQKRTQSNPKNCGVVAVTKASTEITK